jgi:hypothetical protein
MARRSVSETGDPGRRSPGLSALFHGRPLPPAGVHVVCLEAKTVSGGGVIGTRCWVFGRGYAEFAKALPLPGLAGRMVGLEDAQSRRAHQDFSGRSS